MDGRTLSPPLRPAAAANSWLREKLRFSLGTLPVVEFFFAWPGMGRLLLEAINTRQSPVVVALVSALGLTFLTINLVLDVAYRMVDPRTRTQTEGHALSETQDRP